MAGSRTNAGSKRISCETCDRMALDDGSWNKWTEAGPNSKTYHVCYRCLSSQRHYWKDLFSLCQKAGVGEVHLPRGLPYTLSNRTEGSEPAQQQLRNIPAERYRQHPESPYEHSSLQHDQIRILSLLPALDELFCTIEAVDINSAGANYEALSYTWGDKDQPKHTIWINGHPFEVLANLYTALIQLRKPDLTRRLWIDAICINQVGAEGEAEKSVQIPMMAQIYHQSTRVIVWLGSGEDGSEEDSIHSNEVLDVIKQQDVKAMQTRKFALGFGALLERAWFRRTWIVQEVVLGKQLPHLLCGTRAVSYGMFMATHWVLPELLMDSPEMEFKRTLNKVDSNGDIVSSKTFTRKLATDKRNHDRAEKTLAELINMRVSILDDESKLRPRPLFKILPYLKAFSATDPRDKIYGVFGLVAPSVHRHVQVDYQKSTAEVYRDAMTYMFNQEEDERGVIDMYLEYPLPLSLNAPTPELPSWVPDFASNSPFLRRGEDATWYWQYHQTIGPGSHEPLLRKQHGRHLIARETLDRQLVSVDNTKLTVRGFLVDEIDRVIESRYFGLEDSVRDYLDWRLQSQEKVDQHEAAEINWWLDENNKIEDPNVTEITSRADDILPVLATTFKQRYKTNNLYEIDELCRQKLQSAGQDPDPGSWLTFIWRDLLEGYPALDDMSEKEFDEEFYDLAGSDKPITGKEWFFQCLRNEARVVTALPQLNIPMSELFRPPRSFFTTAASGFYGIAPPGVQAADKVAFLFPKLYTAFILRPHGEYYQMLGPCLVPPRLRDRHLEILHSQINQGDEFIII